MIETHAAEVVAAVVAAVALWVLPDVAGALSRVVFRRATARLGDRLRKQGPGAESAGAFFARVAAGLGVGVLLAGVYGAAAYVLLWHLAR